ncbi:sodium-coupled monocarboxylate transporter 1-like [Mercenaria mercenaria]|uniref:sodium-coupled monocarboxylate transporter 1-like n=1 Tax=Mercenaria mercenaria TaxID=6596 RepID=UPI00234E94F4|nr:sodium-coupled monocarboxylate transporter 1-like [Mercenaria mercenaria]
MAAIKQTFTIVDYIVFSLTVLASVAIGIYFAIAGRKKNTTLNYFHGDRKLKYGPVALSLVVTFQSSIMLLGFPAEVYLFGYMICLFNVGQCAAIYVATRIVVPLMYPLKITSVYHYLQLRYGNNSVRILSVTIGIISQSIYMGIVLLGPAIALQSVTKVPVWASIIGIAAAAVIYTSIGGILAVIWTDVLQCVIIIVGIVSTLIKGTVDTGGVQVVFKENIKTGRLDIFDFNPNPTVRHTFWTVLIGSFVGSFSLTLSQSTIQRFNSTPTIGDAKKVMYIAGPVFILMQTMSMSVGLVCFAYYTVNACDPISSGRIRNPNQIVPYMIAEIFSDYPGLSGLFISALFSASLSTLSSILAGLSAVTIEDFIRPHFTLSDSILTVLAKIVVVAFGGIGIAVAFTLSQLEGSLTQILFSIMGAATGPLVGIFFLSMFFRKATDKGAIIGGVAGIVFTFWICIGSTVSRDIPRTKPLPLPPTVSCIGNTSRITNTSLPLNNVTLDLTTRYSANITDFSTKPEVISNLTTATGYNVSQDKSVKGIGKLYTLSYALFSTVGTLFTLFVGICASLITYKNERDKPDPKYMLPLFANICCCFAKLTRGIQTKDSESKTTDEKVRKSLL